MDRHGELNVGRVLWCIVCGRRLLGKLADAQTFEAKAEAEAARVRGWPRGRARGCPSILTEGTGSAQGLDALSSLERIRSRANVRVRRPVPDHDRPLTAR